MTVVSGRRRVVVALAMGMGLLLSGIVVRAEQQPAMLDVSINRVARGQTLVVIDDDEVWVDVAALTDAGVKKVAGERRSWNGRTLVRLSTLAPGVTYELDEVGLALRLTVQPSLLTGSIVDIGSERPPGIEYRRVPSGFLNYGASGTSVGTGSLSLEGGLSARGALVTTTAFADRTGAFRRGLTAITIDDRRRLNRYVVGDAIASTGARGGAVELAGVTLSRDFSLDPYFVRFPTIGLSGAVMTPSRVEVYVNDQLVRVEQLPPGVYQLNHLPLPVGAADTRVVVRDAFGGEQTFASSYYVSQGVLGRGLQQFSYSAGSERLNQFDSSWSYGRPMLLGLHRVGLTDALSVGGRVEASSSLVSGGPMATMRIGRFGQLEAIEAMSRSDLGAGYATSLAYEYTSRAGGLAMAARSYTADYTTLSSHLDPARPRLDLGMSATTRVGSRVTSGASWQAVDYYGRYPSIRRVALTATVTMNRRLSLFVSANRSMLNNQWFNGGFAGLSVAIASREMASVSAEQAAGRGRVTAELQHTLPMGTGVGYRVHATSADVAGSADLDAELRGQTPFGKYAIRQTVINGQQATLADASGGIVFIGGGAHFTRPVEDGFALVRVPEVPRVRAHISNQVVGRTDRHGDLVVPNLLAYYGNRVSINDSDVPMDRDVPRDWMLLAPPYRGGAIALFPALRQWRVSGRFVIDRGTEIVTPSNWTLSVATDTGRVESALGNDGGYYLEGVGPGDHEAVMEGDGVTCAVTLHVPASNQPVIRAGVTTCTAVTAAGERGRR